ncbi:hypothetical protein Leryth_001675 [Lithospermum erythrorhizon]|nr:hypothetical protein Leryth_001675 [Lithospermum erythrorhizon]
MSGGGGSVRNDKPSIKYRFSPLEGASIELAEINSDSFAPPSEISKKNGNIPKENSSGILSTKEFVSAIGHVWDSATGPLSSFLDKSSTRFNSKDIPNGELLSYSTVESTSITGISTNDKTISYSITSNPDSASMVSANLQYVRAIQKKSLLDHSSRHYSDFSRLLSRGSNITQHSWQDVGLGYIGVPHDLRNVYRWMKKSNKPKNCMVSVKTKNEVHTTAPPSITEDCDNVVDLRSSGITAMVGNADHHIDALDNVDFAIVQEVNPVITTLVSSTTTQGENDVNDLQCTGSSTSIRSESSQTDYNLALSGDFGSMSEETECRIRNEDTLCDEIYQTINPITNHVQSEFSISSREKSYHLGSEKRHAVAGAMAGVSVSLCLHPVDTIKTVVQSCRANQSSLHQISKSIISERVDFWLMLQGITGLYRGVSSNVASSAPISAIYTFTYESVKSSLLPLFPKEYQSLAHCMAGGCASVATSFVFTPSECIKQQMQIGSHYQNCWYTLKFMIILVSGFFMSMYILTQIVSGFAIWASYLSDIPIDTAVSSNITFSINV